MTWPQLQQGQPQRTLWALALGFLLAADYTVLIHVLMVCLI